MRELTKNEIRLIGAVVAWRTLPEGPSGLCTWTGETVRVFATNIFARQASRPVRELADQPGARLCLLEAGESPPSEWGYELTAFPIAPPIPARLHCPKCDARHRDEGEWKDRPHYRHRCHACAFEWRVEPYVYGAGDRELGDFPDE